MSEDRQKKKESGPFDGRLSVYLDGEWICGIYEPSMIEKALTAIEDIIEETLPRPEPEQS